MEANKRIPFTKQRLEALRTPPEKRTYVYDEKAEGLCLCVTPTGSKTFYLYRWHAGKPIRMPLGPFSENGLSVEQARDLCRAAIGELAKGIDPRAARKTARQGANEPMLADLWTIYLDLHARPKKRSWQDDERMYNKYMNKLHGKRLSAIDDTAVAKWHAAVAKNHGPIQANRAKALLATMFSKASKHVGYKLANPCIGVPNFPEQSRERFLLPAEMQAFFRALAQEDPYWQAFFLLCLFTGSRRGNVASMEWAEIDLANGVWHIPASKTKNKRPAAVALCEPAAAIIKTRSNERNGSPYIFPAAKGDGHLIDPRKAWNRVLTAMRTCPKCSQIVGQGELIDPKAWKKADRKYRCPKCRANLPPAELPDLHMHDLRRTQGSWQAAMGFSIAIIGKSLGHADLKSTQVYSRLQLDPVKEAVGKATGAMLDAAKVSVNGGSLLIDVQAQDHKAKRAAQTRRTQPR
jgi:integrase